MGSGDSGVEWVWIIILVEQLSAELKKKCMISNGCILSMYGHLKYSKKQQIKSVVR